VRPPARLFAATYLGCTGGRAALANNLTFFDTAEAYNGPENAQSMGGFAQVCAQSAAP